MTLVAAGTRGFEYLKGTLSRGLAYLRRVSSGKKLKLLEVCYFGSSNDGLWVEA